MVPLRVVMEEFGAEVTWDEASVKSTFLCPASRATRSIAHGDCSGMLRGGWECAD